MTASRYSSSELPSRYVTLEDYRRFRPVHAVWEITLACDLKCQHCGSRAGKRRPYELSTEQCFSLIRQMRELGVRHVSLIGGEAYLRADWISIIRVIREEGMECSLQTGALHLTEERIRQAAAAGLQAAGVSIDGLADLHDRLRGVKGSFAAALNALRCLNRYGIVSGVNSQITSLIIPQLREMMELFLDVGARHWQIQLTVPMGRAADCPELLLQPYELLELMPLLAELYQDGVVRGLLIQPGNNIGYFGPYESLWRGSGNEEVHWTGCSAGRNGLGIEADGTIKGCPSLPTSPYGAGNVQDVPLKDIWKTSPQLELTRQRLTDQLWGFCRTCYYADSCRGGCTWMAHSLFGRPGNNPYCHHRVLELAKQGLRERVAQTTRAPGTPFDHGGFQLILEPICTSDSSHLAENRQNVSNLKAISHPADTAGRGSASGLIQIQPASLPGRRRDREVPTLGILCRNCNRHISAQAKVCPHCHRKVRVSAAAHEAWLQKALYASRRIRKLL